MHFEPTYRAMSADDILAAIREQFRHQVEYDPEAAFYRGTELTFETTVALWRETCDLVPCRDLGWALNQNYDTDFSDQEWRAALTPEKERTLRDVCALLAAKARAPVIEARCLAGAPCRAAGAFLLVRDALWRAGADVEELRPSSPAAPWLRKHAIAILLLAEKIAPGSLPPIRIQNAGHDAAIWMMFASFMLSGTGLCLLPSAPWIAITGALLLAAAYLGTWMTGGKPDSVNFGGIATFRDLSFALVGGSAPSDDVGVCGRTRP